MPLVFAAAACTGPDLAGQELVEPAHRTEGALFKGEVDSLIRGLRRHGAESPVIVIEWWRTWPSRNFCTNEASPAKRKKRLSTNSGYVPQIAFELILFC